MPEDGPTRLTDTQLEDSRLQGVGQGYSSTVLNTVELCSESVRRYPCQMETVLRPSRRTRPIPTSGTPSLNETSS